jgi:LemA protein
VPAKAAADDAMQQALVKVNAVAEAYPDLKANQNFLALQEELAATENRVAYARQFYNDAVLTYNNEIQVVPRSVMARRFHFAARDFFDAEPETAQPVKVEF